MMKQLSIILTAVFFLASAESVLSQSQDNALTIGDGVAAYSLQNYEDAASIWRGLAENGSADAAFRLAQLYDLGLGVEHNPLETVKWLEQSANEDHVEAQYLLAGIYASGRGVELNQEKAYEYYSLAAQNNHPQAQYQLGTIYTLGQGVAVDRVKATYWFSKAKDGLADGSEKTLATDVYNSLFNSLSDEQRLELLKELAFSGNNSK